jgi:hypothetical protein
MHANIVVDDELQRAKPTPSLGNWQKSKAS